MWRFPVVIPQAADPMDPDHTQSAIQPCADAAYDLDEHDLEAGGFTNASHIEPDLVLGVVGGLSFGPGMVDKVLFWNQALPDAQEISNGGSWTAVRNTELTITTRGGLVWIAGMVTWGSDTTAVNYAIRVAAALLIDNDLYLDLQPEDGQDLCSVALVNVSLPSGSRLAETEVIDMLVALPAGRHTLQLALQVLGFNAAFAYNAHLSVVEFGC